MEKKIVFPLQVAPPPLHPSAAERLEARRGAHTRPTHTNLVFLHEIRLLYVVSGPAFESMTAELLLRLRTGGVIGECVAALAADDDALVLIVSPTVFSLVSFTVPVADTLSGLFCTGCLLVSLLVARQAQRFTAR